MTETRDLELHRRLEEAEQTLQAIRAGAVDAFVIDGPNGQQIFTLEGAERPYRVMVESMQEGALVVTPEGIVLFGNSRLAELLGIPEHQLAGSTLFQLLDPEQQEAAADLLQAGMEGRAQLDLLLRRHGGGTVPVRVTMSPLRLTEAPMACAIVTDLTTQKEHEALQEADRRKDEFLATLAHELRNPLAPIRNALHVLRLTRPLGSHEQSAWDVIDRQVRQMTHLVDDLLDLSRITRDLLILRREPLDLAFVIRSAIETSQPLIAECDHQLIVSLPDEPVHVDGDLTRLSQVFSNLLNNAAKYTTRGGRIELTARTDGAHVEITVRDNGIGMSPNQLETVFDMFTHVGQSATATSPSGLGIGLTLVRKLVELHGGTVEAASEGPNRGSVLTVRLPQVAGREAGSSDGVVPEAPGSHRILIVDDNRDSADTLATLLTLQGHQVQTAYSGAETLRIGLEFTPEVILLDLGMPSPDGYEICRLLRQHGWGARALVVAVTGWGQQADRRRTREAGFDAHLVKPMDPGRLDEVMATHRAQRASGGRGRARKDEERRGQEKATPA
jgi:PAS domain S-box-containing protein